MKSWHKLKVVECMLRRLSTGNTREHRCIAIPADFWVRVGETNEAQRVLIALEEFRRAHVEAAFGMSFEAAQDEGLAREYLDADARALSVYDALQEVFRERGEVA